jgi:ATPase subunit of ABC transporter with duplicated ATPase domains
MGMRRRPLARAAVVGGVAYHAGKKGAQNAAQEQAQNEQIAELQAQQAEPQYAPPPPQYAAPAAPAAPSAGGDDMVAQLENLKKLLDEGILTQAEFDMQKQKLLAGA